MQPLQRQASSLDPRQQGAVLRHAPAALFQPLAEPPHRTYIILCPTSCSVPTQTLWLGNQHFALVFSQLWLRVSIGARLHFSCLSYGAASTPFCMRESAVVVEARFGNPSLCQGQLEALRYSWISQRAETGQVHQELLCADFGADFACAGCYCCRYCRVFKRHVRASFVSLVYCDCAGSNQVVYGFYFGNAPFP